jgi:HD-like signal output (HDOD) protein
MITTASSAPNGPVAKASTGRSRSAGAAAQPAVRMFGRYQLLKLAGKSQRTMAWVAMDTRDQRECLLVMPRKALQGASALRWQQCVKRASRLNHPHLAQALDMGEHEHWPYVAYDHSQSATWSECLPRQGVAGSELAVWSAQAAQALAFAHEAGVVHLDLQPWMLALDDNQQVLLMGLEVAGRSTLPGSDGGMDELRAVRVAAEADVLALGLVMHHALVGQPALDEPDTGLVIARMPPQGPEIVRLPWTLPRPIPDPLRAIVNRATDRQVRQRYRNARTLQRALEGWLKTLAVKDGGPLGPVLERLRTVGVLPAQPGGAERIAHLTLMEQCRTNELADLVLADIALSFELLRAANGSAARRTRLASEGPVLLLRRAVAMLGLDGVRRCALGLRAWPGPMNEVAAKEMATLIERVHRAARLAVRLAPAGYDPEVIYLITLLQNLGRLVVQYHFPEESQQIRKLTQPEEAGQGAATSAEDAGMPADAASFAVLGFDLEELGVAVASYWGLEDEVQHMIRRISPNAPVHPPEGDQEVLRCSAACANELMDALALPARRVQAGLRQVVQRYGRALGLTGREVQEALQTEWQAQREPGSPALRAGSQAPIG